MRRRLFLCLGIVTIAFQAFSAHAELNAHQKDKLKEIIHAYNESQTRGAFFGNLKSSFTQEQFNFLMEKIKGSENEPVTRLKPAGDDGFSVNLNGSQIQVRFTSAKDHILIVNNKPIDMGASHDMEIQWNLILNAFPHERSEALWNLIVPRAEAGLPLIIGIVGAVVGIYWLWDGDPCELLAEPLVNCKAAVKRFDKLKAAHQDWPWEGTDADRLKKVAAKAKKCEPSEDECDEKKRKTAANDCSPSWASEVDKSDVLAAAIAPLKKGTVKFRASINKYTEKYAPTLSCRDYKELQGCLKTLVHYLNSVCYNYGDLPHLNKALDLPPSEVVR